MSRLLTILLILFLSQSAYAQNLSWKKLKKLATKYAADKQYGDAADHFMDAYKLNSSKKELLYEAANNYFKNTDYVNASDAFADLKEDISKYPKARLNYAFSLKQEGKYEEAIIAFALFDNNYDGTKKQMWRRLVEQEIKGCELGQELAKSKVKRDIEVSWLNGNVNTIENETAPLLFGDDLLYYTSTIGLTQGIYRSQKLNGDWQSGQEAKGLPDIVGDFGNGAFSPTKERFYFTTCLDETTEDGTIESVCRLNFIQQTKNGWTEPMPLPDKVNAPNSTCTHPTVVHMLEKEVVFFSSDRVGGKGGMDIWYTTTSMNTDTESVFTLPNNLGRMVNSVRDDITPFYDVPTQTLYFSSNGYPTIGGYDIFASTGDLVRFEEPVHLGIPINSAADDLFYITSPVTEGNGLFVSNRMFGNERIHTRDLDIFAYNLPEKNLVVKGSIIDKETKSPVVTSKVALYEILKSGKKRLLSKIDSNNGDYQFKLLPNKKFVVESDITGYPTGSQAFNTIDLKTIAAIKKDIFIDKHDFQQLTQQPIFANAQMSAPKVIVPKTTPNVVIATPAPQPTPSPSPTIVTTPAPAPTPSTTMSTPARTSQTVTTTPNTSRTVVESYPSSNNSNTSVSSFTDNTQNTNVAPSTTRTVNKVSMPKGEFYKIQLIAVKKYNPNHKRYREVKQLARLESEYIPVRDLDRIMMGDYFSLSIARRKLEDVKNMTDFKDAYIVRYKDGKRKGPVDK